jgi:hypothetical protein
VKEVAFRVDANSTVSKGGNQQGFLMESLQGKISRDVGGFSMEVLTARGPADGAVVLRAAVARENADGSTHTIPQSLKGSNEFGGNDGFAAATAGKFMAGKMLRKITHVSSP